ncbi:hypothetical protein GCM10010381_04850 [Streptomyces xantholiticus]|nr:hypothetical protein GCM10010381_04850 [Streptomyces xantholiticus]
MASSAFPSNIRNVVIFCGVVLAMVLAPRRSAAVHIMVDRPIPGPARRVDADRPSACRPVLRPAPGDWEAFGGVSRNPFSWTETPGAKITR